MQLTDYSQLRSTELIEIPLNGKIYKAVTDPPGAIVLAMTTVDFDPDLIEKATGADGGLDQSSLTPKETADTIRAANSQARKQLRFLDEVLTPESAEEWRYFFAPLPALEDGKAHPKKTTDEHKRHRITAGQMAAVVRDLVSLYSGRRPTEPLSSSSNGGSGSGQTSTASAPSKG